MTIDEALAVRDRARFQRPALSGHLVPRPRLEASYPPVDASVVRVLAPGGFGKSTLVASWVTGDRREVRWVDLEATDDDAAALVRTIRWALDGLIDPEADSLPVAPHGGLSVEDLVVPTFGAVVGAIDEPFALVLDDVHRILSPGATALIRALAEHVPAHSTLVLVGRAQHDDEAMARLHLRPGVLELSTGELAMDVAEAGELLGSMGLELDAGEIAALRDRMEGWPAGLRLAGLMLAEGATVAELLERDDSDPALIVDYVRAEWTGNLDADDLAFLHGAACLDRFSAEACDEVLGVAGSATRLRRLHRDARLLLPLDRRDAWFRMHSMLARWLEADLRARDPERHRRVHLAAAAYWDARGDVDLAVRHAARAGDLAVCETLVATHGATYLTWGRHSTVQSWLDLFPPEYVGSSAALCAIGSANALHGGDGALAHQWFRRLEHLLATDAAPGGEATCWADCLAAALDTAPTDELLTRGDRARDELRAGVWRAFADWAVGGLSFVAGEPRALGVLDEGAFEAKVADASLLRANCLATAAIVLAIDGDGEGAERRGREAQGIVGDRRAELFPTTAAVTAWRAWSAAAAGRGDEARRSIGLAHRHLDAFASVGPWFNVVVRLALIHAAALLDERATSRSLLDELDQLFPGGEPPAGVEAVVADLHRQVDALPGVPDHVGGMTEAELRVLRFLPTNLSLAEIAGELFLSRNTVKSHAAAIYRKLGVTSRSDAVALARSGGLIP